MEGEPYSQAASVYALGSNDTRLVQGRRRAGAEDEEAVRDLCRGRDDVRVDLMRARHRLGKFLLRRGRVFGTGSRAWSQAHRWWLGTQTFERTAERVMFEDYLLAVEQAAARRHSLELHLEDIARELVGYVWAALTPTAQATAIQ